MQGHLANGIPAWRAQVIFFGYFTIVTHLLVCVALTAPLLAPGSAWDRFFTRPCVVTALATHIVLVGLGYYVLLRGIWDPQGWQLLADRLMHGVMPSLYVLFWAFTVPKQGLRWRDPLRWCVYPVAYFCWVLVRGVWIADYPYSFLDAATLGYGGALLNGIGLLAVDIAIGLMLVGVGRRMAAPGRPGEP